MEIKLIVSILKRKQRVSPDTLFTLFGVYGDVLRVKILFNKKDTALVQMSTAQQAYARVYYSLNIIIHLINLVKW